MTQTQIAKITGKTQAYISMLMAGKRNPSWQMALQLAEITKTEPVDWMDPDKDRNRLLKAA